MFLMRLILLFLVIFIPLPSKANSISHDCRQALDDITESVAKQLAQKYDMIWAEGWANLSLNYQVRRPLLQPEVNKLINECVQTLLQALNSNANAIACHGDVPFKSENINVTIYFSSPKDLMLFAPFVSSVGLSNNRIHYYYNNASERLAANHTVFEPYEASYNFAEINNGRMKSIERVIEKIAKKMRANELILAGMGYDEDHVALGFDLYRPMDLQQARDLLIKANQATLQEVRSLSDQWSLDNIEVSIDSYKRRPRGLFPDLTAAPKISTIYYGNGKVVYRILNQQHRENKIEESYSNMKYLMDHPTKDDPVREFAARLSSDQ